MLVVGSIVIRVRDLPGQVAFWTAALDDVAREPLDDDFALLHSRSGTGPNVSLDAMPSERVLPPRIHLDLYATDRQAEVERLLDLGAVVQPTGDAYNVLKVKPPLCIDAAGAEHLVAALERTLREGY